MQQEQRNVKSFADKFLLFLFKMFKFSNVAFRNRLRMICQRFVSSKVSQIISFNFLKLMPADQIQAGMQISFAWKLLDDDTNELNLEIKLAAFLAVTNLKHPDA